MPTYVYECKSCGQQLEVKQRVTDPAPSACAECAGELRKKFFPSRVIFRGSGWYITDSKPSGNGAEKVADSVPEAASDGVKPSEPVVKAKAESAPPKGESAAPKAEAAAKP